MRYDQIDYWDERYTEDTQRFEWFQRYSGIRHFLSPKYLMQFSKSNEEQFPHSKRVLILGCGNSQLGEEMLADGFKHITHVDFSSVVIKQMQKWHKQLQNKLGEERRSKDATSSPKSKLNRTRLFKSSPTKQPSTSPVRNQLSFLCNDITKKLEFDDESFDLIVCKGALDAVLCNRNAHEKIQTMMRECHRVLDDCHGAMLVVSHGGPDDRMGCFDTALWKEIKSYTAPKPMVPGMTEAGAEHHVYILFKRESRKSE